MSEFKDIVLVMIDSPKMINIDKEINFIKTYGSKVGVHIIFPDKKTHNNGTEVFLNRYEDNGVDVYEGMLIYNKDSKSEDVYFARNYQRSQSDYEVFNNKPLIPGVIEIGRNKISDKPVSLDITKDSPFYMSESRFVGRSSIAWSVINNIIQFEDMFDLYVVDHYYGVVFAELAYDDRVELALNNKDTIKIMYEIITIINYRLSQKD